jgi:xanthine/CO dehydrogenase XdhC/CoxF family maturation factor
VLAQLFVRQYDIQIDRTQPFVYDCSKDYEKRRETGQGAGCNGIIRVLLEPVNSCLHKQLCKLKFYLDSGYRVTMIKINR